MGMFPPMNLGCLSQVKFRFSSNFTAKSSQDIRNSFFTKDMRLAVSL